MARRNRDPRQRPMDFMLPESDWQHCPVLPDLRGRGRIAVDLETRDDGLRRKMGSGWVYGAGHIAGVAVAVEGQTFYANVRHPDGPVHDEDAVRRWVRDHMHSGDVPVMHNSPYDLGWLLSVWDIPLPEVVDDTQIMAYLLDENRLSYSLDEVCRAHGVDGKDEDLLREAADALGCDPKADMWRMPEKFVAPYAVQDARATLEVASAMRAKLQGQRLEDAYRLECDLIPMIVEMRRRGVRIDMDRAPQIRDQLRDRRDQYLGKISDRLSIGRSVEMSDIQSPAFLKRVFDDESIPYSTTEKGNPSFKTDEIEKIDHWLPELICGARKAQDAGEKFIGKYIMEFAHMGRIHSEARSTKTRTTRFAYSDPPLQQMPSRNPEIAGMIRGLFLPEEGQVWGALDYSQQEFRLMVHFASLCGMAGVDDAVHKYRTDPRTDFHDLAAELTKLPRRKAKDVNFAKAFGAGRAKFALMTGMALEEAAQVMTQYDEELPFISRLSEFCQNRANKNGYVKLLDGARCHFDRWEVGWVEREKFADGQRRGLPMHACGIEEARQRVNDPEHPWYGGRLRRHGTHKAMNSVFQGSAARQTKLCMRECWREGIVPMLQLHDELGFTFSEKKTALRAQEIMVETVSLEVPVVVDAEFGTNWGDSMNKRSFEEAMELVS